MTTRISPDAWRRAQVAGPRPRLDPRRYIATGEITDIALAGLVAAARYTRSVPMACRVARTAMRNFGQDDATAVSELLWGESFDLFDVVGDWGFGRSAHDNYTGWVPMAALSEAVAGPSRQVSVRVAPLFAKPDIKTPAIDELPFGARVEGTEKERFFAVASGGFIHLRHLAPLPTTPLAVARGFTGAPYLWGGRTPLGVDCSGLVQASLIACGIACPRDSDEQCDELGVAVDFADRKGGDLVFFPGHVGILVDAETLLHANAHWMTVVEEPLTDVIGRLNAAGTPVAVTGVRRIQIRF